MKSAREDFLADVAALGDAVSPDGVGAGAGIAVEPGVGVLRRGAAITALIMLETFFRRRVEELLDELAQWPRGFGDFPDRFRNRATIEALPHIERFAKMLRREGEDYEAVIREQVGLMTSVSVGSLRFTKFVAGDYTGNLSERVVEELLKVFQVRGCWAGMHSLSADVGFGVPSVKEVLNTIVRNRHRSAHVVRFTPAAADVSELPQNLHLVGICIDAALSASVRVAVDDWRAWLSEGFDWRARLRIYFIIPSGGRFRLVKRGANRATRVVDAVGEARVSLPANVCGGTCLLVEKSSDGRPKSWDII